MSGKKIFSKSIHLDHDDNELLEALAHARGISCSQLLHDLIQPSLDEEKRRFNSMAKLLGWAPRADRSERTPGLVVHEDRPNYSRMH